MNRKLVRSEFYLTALCLQIVVFVKCREQVPVSMTIGNVELMQEYSPERLRKICITNLLSKIIHIM